MALAFLLIFSVASLDAAERASHLSASRRFAVRGLPAAPAAELARWCDDVAGRVATRLGAEAPFAPGEWIEIFCDEEAPADRGRVVKGQGYVDGRLQQRLSVINVASADQEDMLEGLVWLLVNRYVIQEQTSAERAARLGATPDWLAVGVAQGLYPELRQRNTRLVVARWLDGATVDLPGLLDHEFLPPGRWIEKAQAGLTVDWMSELAASRQGYAALWRHLAAAPRPDLAWLARDWLGFPSLRELNKSWDLWLARQQLVVTASAEGLARLARLRKLLEVRPEDYAVAGVGVPPGLTPARMIEQRAEPWMPVLAGRVNLSVQSVGLGQGADLQEVTRAYGQFFDALERAGRKGRGLLGARTDASRLQKLLNEADERLVRLERAWSERSRYLDDVASGRANGPGQVVAEDAEWGSVEGADAERIRSYLDEVERRQPATP